MIVSLRNRLIIRLSVVVLVFGGIFAHVQAMVGLVNIFFLISILLLETFILDFLRLMLQLLPSGRVISQNKILMSVDILKILMSTLIIQLSLSLFLFFQISLVPFHHCVVLISSWLDLIGELRMLLRNPDLFLQPLLFVVQLTEAVLEHHSFLLLLFHVKLLLELAWAVYSSRFVHLLWWAQVIQLDIAKAKIRKNLLIW